MSNPNAISEWLADLKNGDTRATEPLWKHYFQQLVRLAHRRLQDDQQRVADGEDVALSAFASFCRGVEQGRFPELSNREDLWRILIAITNRKVIDYHRYLHRQRRGSGNVRGDSVMPEHEGFDAVADVSDPEVALAMAEELTRLLNVLNDEQLKAVAVSKMEGFTNAEIADRLDCSVSTVERSLRLIRKHWEQELGQES